jgi:predicted metal-dependent phosphoesterase TrpH
MKYRSFLNPFRTKGEWFKGNLHTHSNNSDGILTPWQLSYLYKSNGYDFISITDHDFSERTKLIEIEDLSEHFDNFLLIPGEEICNVLDLVAINLKEQINPKAFSNPQRVIDEILKQKGEVIIAHPYWESLTLETLLSLKGYLGIEIYNTTVDLSVAKGYSTVHWDNLLVEGRHTFGFAVDDSHGGLALNKPIDTCKAWINVKAESLEIEVIMESLRKGLFYSSTGPEIYDLELKGKSITVKTSSASSIRFIGKNGWGKCFYPKNKDLKQATYQITGHETYIRIEVKDELGRTAWINPIVTQAHEM